MGNRLPSRFAGHLGRRGKTYLKLGGAGVAAIGGVLIYNQITDTKLSDQIESFEKVRECVANATGRAVEEVNSEDKTAKAAWEKCREEQKAKDEQSSSDTTVAASTQDTEARATETTAAAPTTVANGSPDKSDTSLLPAEFKTGPVVETHPDGTEEIHYCEPYRYTEITVNEDQRVVYFGLVDGAPADAKPFGGLMSDFKPIEGAPILEDRGIIASTLVAYESSTNPDGLIAFDGFCVERLPGVAETVYSDMVFDVIGYGE